MSRILPALALVALGALAMPAQAQLAQWASTTVPRPADTTAYAANDAWADSTSAPTVGGFMLEAGRQAGDYGWITDVHVTSTNDPATPLQGEVWIFNSAVTAVNDSAAFALSDADAVKRVCIVPFLLATSSGGSGANSQADITGLNCGFITAGSVYLRFLVKVKNAYTPASGEALTVSAMIARAN